MSGTKEGAAKSVAMLKARDPEHFAKIGRKGGQASRGGGFALMDAETHRAASAKGGATSRRTKAKKSNA